MLRHFAFFVIAFLAIPFAMHVLAFYWQAAEPYLLAMANDDREDA